MSSQRAKVYSALKTTSSCHVVEYLRALWINLCWRGSAENTFKAKGSQWGHVSSSCSEEKSPVVSNPDPKQYWNNRPFPSSPTPLFQNEVRCTTFLVKMSFICTRMKNDFHITGWAPNLVLKQRPGWTRKWPIERMTCHCFLRPIRRDLTSSSYRTQGSLVDWSAKQLEGIGKYTVRK